MKTLKKTTSTNLESWLKPKGYHLEYHLDAMFTLEPHLDFIIEEAKEAGCYDEQLPYGETILFDIMIDEGGKEYAVYITDTACVESDAYYLEIE